jgi:aldehyde dehydrogenase (NAD+)
MNALPASARTTLPEGLIFIDGKLRRARHDRTYENIGPWTGEAMGVAADASRADVEDAIVAARRAFD